MTICSSLAERLVRVGWSSFGPIAAAAPSTSTATGVLCSAPAPPSSPSPWRPRRNCPTPPAEAPVFAGAAGASCATGGLGPLSVRSCGDSGMGGSTAPTVQAASGPSGRCELECRTPASPPAMTRLLSAAPSIRIAEPPSQTRCAEVGDGETCATVRNADSGRTSGCTERRSSYRRALIRGSVPRRG